jgi:hypothetical protein
VECKKCKSRKEDYTTKGSETVAEVNGKTNLDIALEKSRM